MDTTPPASVSRRSFSGIGLPGLLCLLAFFILLMRFPGVWDSDTVVQQGQMLSGLYTDWHPPLLAWLWRWLNIGWNALWGQSYTGSGLLFLVHGLAAFGGLFFCVRASAIFWKECTPRLYAIALGLFAFFLFAEFVPMMRFVWKDTGMLAAWLLACGLMLDWQGTSTHLKRVSAGVMILLCLFYGLALRHNSMFALVPLLCLFFWRVMRLQRFTLLGCTLLLWLAMLGAVQGVHYGILKAEETHIMQERYFADIYALNWYSKHYIPAPDVYGNKFSALDEQTFRTFYTKVPYVVRAFEHINAVLSQPLHVSGNRERYAGETAVLQKAWLDRIARDPAKYLDIRRKIFLDFLENSFMLLGANLLLVLLLLTCLPPLLHPLRLSATTNPRFPRIMLGLSAILYVLPYYVFLPDLERRYLFWFFIAAGLSLAMYGWEILKNRKWLC